MGRPGWLDVDTEAGALGARRDYRVYCDPHKPKDYTARASQLLPVIEILVIEILGSNRATRGGRYTIPFGRRGTRSLTLSSPSEPGIRGGAEWEGRWLWVGPRRRLSDLGSL